jgi:hypothetical protein
MRGPGRGRGLAVVVALGALVSLGAFATVAGCRRDTVELPPPPPTVRVLSETAVVRQGAIGVQDRQDATYVLVEGVNGSPEPRLVSLEGELVDAGGASLARLALEELYVPAGETRVFALVANAKYPTAVGAKLRVRAGPVAKDPPPAIVRDLATERKATAFVAVPTLETKLDREVVATIIVAFYDAQGKILARTFTPVQLAPHSSRPFAIEGPPAAVRALAYVGDAMY